MFYIAKHAYTPLSYRSLIAHIIKVFEIDISVVKGDYILPTKADSATLSRMGYIKQGSEWRKKLKTDPQRLRKEAKERR